MFTNNLQPKSKTTVAALLLSLGLIAGTPAVALADANPNNRGHHYGQLKHQHSNPAPTPTPAPVTTPAPAPGVKPAPQPSVPPVSQPQLSLPVAAGIAAAPATRSPLPAPVRVAVKTPPAPAGFDLYWLLLVILPLLLVIGVIALRGLVVGALASAGAQGGRQPVASPKPI